MPLPPNKWHWTRNCNRIPIHKHTFCMLLQPNTTDCNNGTTPPKHRRVSLSWRSCQDWNWASRPVAPFIATWMRIASCCPRRFCAKMIHHHDRRRPFCPCCAVSVSPIHSGFSRPCCPRGASFFVVRRPRACRRAHTRPWPCCNAEICHGNTCTFPSCRHTCGITWRHPIPT